jgi:uncharacterized protein
LAISLYDTAIPSFRQFLGNVAGLIVKAQEHCQSKGVAPETLLQARLCDDMWPFAAQVFAASTNSWGHIKDMPTGTCRPDRTPPPTDFAGLRACIDDALVGLAALDVAQFNALADRDVRFVVRDHHVDFTVPEFFFTFCLPNFYFHVTTAYDILRSQGLLLAKRDYLGQMRTKP